MQSPFIPINEHVRIQDVKDCFLLDSDSEAEYDDITRIASEIAETPIALITIIDSNRQWFKSHFGLHLNETHRDVSFCGHAINEPDKIMVVNDAREDFRFFDNPLVIKDPHLVFYLGIPIVTSNNTAIGTFCVADYVPRELTKKQIDYLKSLANQVVKLIELRKRNFQLEKVIAEKNALVREINHRVKNNLSIILGLINLEMDNDTSPLLQNRFKELHSKIFSIATNENLLYDSKNYHEIDFSKFITETLLRINRTFLNIKDFKVKADFSACILDISIAVPLGLIVNNLFVSIFKDVTTNHAFTQIVVSYSMSYTNKELIFELPIRLTSDVLLKESIESGLLRDLAEQIDAKISYSENINSTFIKIVF